MPSDTRVVLCRRRAGDFVAGCVGGVVRRVYVVAGYVGDFVLGTLQDVSSVGALFSSGVRVAVSSGLRMDLSSVYAWEDLSPTLREIFVGGCFVGVAGVFACSRCVRGFVVGTWSTLSTVYGRYCH